MSAADRIEAALALHQPANDPTYSIVTWTYCTCGAMEVHVAEDGHRSLGPAKYPCATRRALLGEET